MTIGVQKAERFKAQHEQKKKNRLELMFAIDKRKENGIAFNELCRNVNISRPQISKHIRKLIDERYIEKRKGSTLVKKKDREYSLETELYFLTPRGENELKNFWFIERELERMHHDIEIDKTLPDSDRKLELLKYSGHSQSSGWGTVYFPYEISIHSNNAPKKNFNFLYELEKGYFANMERHILEKMCSIAMNDGIIPLDIDTQNNNSEIWAELSKKISNEYLLDDNAEIFVGFHTKIKDLRTWLLSNMGISRLRAVLTDTPFPIDDWIGVNIEELKPIFEITNKDILDRMDLKGLPIPKLSLRELMIWFQMDKDGQKYFSPFAPITYSNKFYEWMKEQYEKNHPNENKLIAWMDTDEGKRFEQEGLTIFKKEQDEVNAHRLVHIGWAEMLKWLMSKDGQIYLKALWEIAPFPHKFHMFIGNEKGRWSITPSKRVQAVSIKKDFKNDKPEASQ